MNPTFIMKSTIWQWNGPTSWYFASLSEELSQEIKGFDIRRKAFGSVPVEVRIRKTTWKTSIFWSKKGQYILPLKKEIRKKEYLKTGQEITAEITLR